jgi:hypothetical protein
MNHAAGDVAMRITHQVVVFDAADIAAESRFWAGVLDGVVDAEDDWHMVVVDGEPRIGVQLAPNHVPPDWPDGTPQQQIHLDLWVEDFDIAHERVMSLGAKVLKPAADVDTPDNLQVYADPAGHRSACAGSSSVRIPRYFRGDLRRGGLDELEAEVRAADDAILAEDPSTTRGGP